MPIRLLTAHNPGPWTGTGNNTWLVDGQEPALVDAGVGEAAHLDAIAAALDGRPLARVLVTHGHPDHASGVPALRQRWPGTEICVWKDVSQSDTRPLGDGDRVRAGDIDLTVVYTPGHAADHICFWHEASGDVFGGDMIIAGSTVMIPAGKGGGLRAYIQSLERLAALEPRRILPGHGPIVDRPLELIARYIQHRRRREAQVLSCLEAGITSVDEIVSRVYPDVAEGVRRAARLTVEAHIEMLREEGRWI